MGNTPVNISIDDHDENTKFSLKKLVDDRKIDAMVNIDEEKGNVGCLVMQSPFKLCT